MYTRVVNYNDVCDILNSGNKILAVIRDSGNSHGFSGLSWNIREGWQLCNLPLFSENPAYVHVHDDVYIPWEWKSKPVLVLSASFRWSPQRRSWADHLSLWPLAGSQPRPVRWPSSPSLALPRCTYSCINMFSRKYEFKVRVDLISNKGTTKLVKQKFHTNLGCFHEIATNCLNTLVPLAKRCLLIYYWTMGNHFWQVKIFLHFPKCKNFLQV